MQTRPFFKFLNHDSPTVESAALVLAGTGAIGTILAILKNALLASRFGASQELDIYFAAFRVPDFFYNVFIFGALTAGFLPVFSRWLQGGKDKAWELVSSLLTIFLLFLGLAAAAVFLFAEPLARILVPGFSPEATGDVAVMLRILMLQPILLSFSNLIASTLQVFRKFFIYSLAPLFYNLGIILGILWFSSFWGIWGVAWGVVLGAFLHFLIQVPAFISLGFKFSFRLRETLLGLKEVFSLMVPRAVALAANQINILILTIIASTLPEGSLTIFNFSDSLQGVPTSLLVISFVTAAFPALSELWAKSDLAAFRKLFAKTLSELLIWTIPAALILFAFREAVVALTLAYGSFDFESQAKTVTAFGIFILALPLQGLRVLLLRSFFASGDTRTPLLSYLGSMPVVILSASRLGLSFGVSGLAFAIVLGTVIDTGALCIIFQRRFRDLYLKEISRIFGKSLFLGFFAALSGWLTFQGMGFFIQEASFGLTLFRTLIALVPVGIVLFIGIFMYKIFDLRVFAEEGFETNPNGPKQNS